MDIRETKLDLGAEEGGEGITNEPCRSWKGGGPGKEMCRRGQGLWPPRPPPLPRPRARPPRPSMPARPGAGVGAASSVGAAYSTGATRGWGRRSLLRRRSILHWRDQGLGPSRPSPLVHRRGGRHVIHRRIRLELSTMGGEESRPPAKQDLGGGRAGAEGEEGPG
jgi:hypothetical protein